MKKKHDRTKIKFPFSKKAFLNLHLYYLLHAYLCFIRYIFTKLKRSFIHFTKFKRRFITHQKTEAMRELNASFCTQVITFKIFPLKVLETDRTLGLGEG